MKYQGKFNESKLRKILEKHGLKEEDGIYRRKRNYNL